MRAQGRSRVWGVGMIALAVIFVSSEMADARPRRHRPPSPVRVVLLPFLAVRTAVHAVAEPIVFRGPRVIRTVVTAPRRAYREREQVYHAEAAEESEPEDEDDSYAQQEEAEPIRVAYYNSRTRRAAPPRAERAYPMDEDEDDRVQPTATSGGSGRKFRESRRSATDGGREPRHLRNGVAHAPANAPQSVKNAIWAANSLRRKPYIWGGGHGSFYDRGYDCSGTVSFALHNAGALTAPLPSRDFMRYGERGRGRWITIYARPGHTFAVIAGLRLDTTDFLNGGNTGPRWHADARDTRGYVARHPAGM